MKKLILLMTFVSFPLLAQDSEGDLQLPVTELPEIQKEEERPLPPTIDEVPMYEDEKKSEEESKMFTNPPPKMKTPKSK